MCHKVPEKRGSNLWQCPNKHVFSYALSTYPGAPGRAVGWLVRRSVRFSLCVSGPSQSVRRPYDVIYFLKAMTFPLKYIAVPHLSVIWVIITENQITKQR